jgi:organic radical activating enzyme
MPFISIMLNTDTFIRFCCIASGPEAILRDKDGKKLSVGTSSIEEAWNSPTMQQVRKDMMEGTPVSACSHCYKQESIDKKSFRQMMTDEWKNRLGSSFHNYVKEAIDNEWKISLPPVYLDLRLGNLCNLKCRMCNPFNSSQIAKEHFELYEEDTGYKSVWADQFGQNPTHLKEESVVFDSNFLWNDIIGIIPSLKKVYMTGGEPTLIKNNFRFMEECINAGYNDQIELFFNINCTNVTDKFLELISQFKSIKINCSLDGVEKVNDYIRSPSRWEKIDINFRKLAALPNVNLGVSPVIQVYNILDCHNILEYIDRVSKEYKKDISVDFLINDHPSFLDVTIVSKDIRKKGITNLKGFSETHLVENEITRNSIHGIINLFEKPLHEDSERLYHQFVVYTKTLDKRRKEDFATSLPELAKELNFE